jgi:hypothetical protein
MHGPNCKIMIACQFLLQGWNGKLVQEKAQQGKNKDFLSNSETTTVTEATNNLCTQQDVK